MIRRLAIISLITTTLVIACIAAPAAQAASTAKPKATAKKTVVVTKTTKPKKVTVTPKKTTSPVVVTPKVVQKAVKAKDTTVASYISLTFSTQVAMYGAPVTATITVTNGGDPVAGQNVTLPLGATFGTLTGTTDANGVVTLPLPKLTVGFWPLSANTLNPDGSIAVTSPEVLLAIGYAPTTVTIAGTKNNLASEQKTTVVVTVTTPVGPAAGVELAIDQKSFGYKEWEGLGDFTTDANGKITIPVNLWRTATFRAIYLNGGDNYSGGGTVSFTYKVVSGVVSVAKEDPKAPKPKELYPIGAEPIGNGANAVSGPITDEVWKSMQGYTYNTMCAGIGRNGLAQVDVNYWGFDGYRYRGTIIVRKSIAGSVKKVFTSLYNQQFRIRQMHPEDAYGHNPLGPGANDYASMAADNTSGFNCRYVVGQEKQKNLSPHATGLAIDINTWENPYSSSGGAKPNAYFLKHRSGAYAGVMSSTKSPAVKAFTSQGFEWGGTWTKGFDPQHFQK